MGTQDPYEAICLAARKALVELKEDRDMNILLMTNTYKPMVGGLEKSVSSFTKEYQGSRP